MKDPVRGYLETISDEVYGFELPDFDEAEAVEHALAGTQCAICELFCEHGGKVQPSNRWICNSCFREVACP